MRVQHGPTRMLPKSTLNRTSFSNMLVIMRTAHAFYSTLGDGFLLLSARRILKVSVINYTGNLNRIQRYRETFINTFYRTREWFRYEAVSFEDGMNALLKTWQLLVFLLCKLAKDRMIRLILGNYWRRTCKIAKLKVTFPPLLRPPVSPYKLVTLLDLYCIGWIYAHKNEHFSIVYGKNLVTHSSINNKTERFLPLLKIFTKFLHHL